MSSTSLNSRTPTRRPFLGERMAISKRREIAMHIRNFFSWRAFLWRWHRRYLNLKGHDNCSYGKYCGGVQHVLLQRTVKLQNCSFNTIKYCDRPSQTMCPSCFISRNFRINSKYWNHYVELLRTNMNDNCNRCPSYAKCATLGL
jgi:hypothetical protein